MFEHCVCHKASGDDVWQENLPHNTSLLGDLTSFQNNYSWRRGFLRPTRKLKVITIHRCLIYVWLLDRMCGCETPLTTWRNTSPRDITTTRYRGKLLTKIKMLKIIECFCKCEEEWCQSESWCQSFQCHARLFVKLSICLNNGRRRNAKKIRYLLPQKQNIAQKSSNLILENEIVFKKIIVNWKLHSFMRRNRFC